MSGPNAEGLPIGTDAREANADFLADVFRTMNTVDYDRASDLMEIVSLQCDRLKLLADRAGEPEPLIVSAWRELVPMLSMWGIR